MKTGKKLELEIVTCRPALSRMHVKFYAYDEMGKFAAVADARIGAGELMTWLDMIHDFEAKAQQDELPFA